MPVSGDASGHLRFGPSFLHRNLPFFVATYLERLIVLLVPLLVIVVPLINLLPQLFRWRVRSRIYRLYGELKLLEREVVSASGTFPSSNGSPNSTASSMRPRAWARPSSYASEAYTLREHIALVRRSVVQKAVVQERSETGEVA